MKVLLYDETPAYFCPGGKQVVAQRLHDALRAIGVDVEFARWWDPHQRCDVIHMLGHSPAIVWAARQAGAKTVLTHIVDGMTNASPARRQYHRIRNGLLRTSPSVARLFSWHVLPQIDALVYMHPEDAATARELYGVAPNRSCVIPHGCTGQQLESIRSGPRRRSSYLVSTGSIVPRKNAIVLARVARRAKVPVMFIGKPFNEDDAYFQEFQRLADGTHVIYRGYVSETEKLETLQGASGFVLLSKGESGCIAVYEAAAAGLPLFLADLPWARGYGVHDGITRVSLLDERALAERLASFFATSARLPAPTFPVVSWNEVAAEHLKVYRRVLEIP
jgi:glycosyltransferase involved in cell wall biosynthesis